MLFNLILLLAFAPVHYGFMVPVHAPTGFVRATKFCKPMTTLFMAGAPAQAPAKVKQAQKTSDGGGKGGTEQVTKTADPKTRVEVEVEEAPRFKLLLIGDEEYSEEHVVERMVDLVDDLDKKQGVEVYYAAQKAGKGLIGVFVLEMAEFYAEQLARSEPMIFTDLVKEGKAQ